MVHLYWLRRKFSHWTFVNEFQKMLKRRDSCVLPYLCVMNVKDLGEDRLRHQNKVSLLCIYYADVLCCSRTNAVNMVF
uniref:Uncharacterized protein n=1 Tax=Anguilla anguilla TaxID=7936 RepID=A0A0E9RVL6_ANGAN